MIEIPQEVIERLKQAKHVAILTGAGVSAESGIKTFRDPDGIWQKLNPAELASIDGFMANPKIVAEWYKMRKDGIDNTTPNPGHEAIAKMQKLFPKFTLITQNVDRLHQRAGSEDVIELHGNIVTNRCFDCNEPYEGDTVLPNGELPKCGKCSGKIRPNVVWFGEMLPQDALMQAEVAAQECDVFFSIGTTAEVYPAGNLPLVAKNSGAFVIEVNPNRTVISQYCDAVLSAPSGMAMPILLEKLK